MPPPDPQPLDSDRDASSDEDFNPSAAASVSSSDWESDGESKSPQHRKRKRAAVASTGDAELDSGDEVTIRARQKRVKKKGQNLSDDEGGEGGFIKTRAQRRTEKVERTPLARTLHTTIDVDSVWAKLSSLPVGRLPTPPQEEAEAPAAAHEDYITIRRRTKFAGEVTVESKRVHKDSAEAKLYLTEQADSQPDVEVTERPVNRPLRRASRFEPNPPGEVKGLPPHLQLRWPRHGKAAVSAPAAQDKAAPNAAKLNVVQKSRHDWAGFVDKQGIQAELDEYGKSKASYLGREEFLNRTEARLEEERKAVRLANVSKPVQYAE